MIYIFISTHFILFYIDSYNRIIKYLLINILIEK